MKAFLLSYPKDPAAEPAVVELDFSPAMEAYAKQLNGWPEVILQGDAAYTLESWNNDKADYVKASLIVAEVPK